MTPKGMRSKEEALRGLSDVAAAAPAQAATESVYDLVRPVVWPVLKHADPELHQDGNPRFDRPLPVRMKDSMHTSIEEHCKRLGVDKSVWVREHLMRGLAEEQDYFRKGGDRR